MQANRMPAIAAVFAIGTIFFGTSLAFKAAHAQVPSAQTPKPAAVAASNDLQRAVEVYGYDVAAKSGATRGEVIYYYKCWNCHNDYTRAAGSPAPTLRDIFKRTTLVTGDPVNDDTVAKQIRNGSAQMPSFGTALKDADIADLLAYLHAGCCYEETNPPVNPWYRANAQNSSLMPERGNLRGGPRGVVRSAAGEPLEGIMVQLIAPNAVRTTVTSNQDGQYEFPQLLPGSYTLRIAKPLQFLPYQRDAVQVESGVKLDDILLQRRSETDFLPATTDVLSQLTGAEWLWNLPGTAEEKQTFSRTCGEGCHGYEQIMRNRLDERSWRLMIFRMLHYSGSPLIVRGRQRGSLEQEEMIIKWLARVRGPETPMGQIRVFPRAHGPATNVVVTEYELPHVLLTGHDVSGDSKGNIWYSSHRTPFLGKLDPKTGIVTEYQVPATPPGVLPGTHRIQVDKNDIVWASENWAHNLVRLDPATGDFTITPLKAGDEPLNTPGLGNFSIGPDIGVWFARNKAVQKFDSKTGKLLERVPFTADNNANPYDNIITDDGNFWAGGAPAGGGDTIEMMDTRTNKLLEVHSFSRDSTAAKGGFDAQGNPWFGGRGGALLELDVKAAQIREFWPPTPYVTFYEAMPDKRGEVWAGELHGGRMLRFNPKADHWTEYVLPEPYSHDRRTWIDNSTTPVTVWYVDHNSYLVRVQARE
jgi:streptogramin lyase/mono/diheme cytochrome c family protein